MRIGSRLSTHLALAPALLIALVAYCGAMGWTIWISFTNSRMLPSSVFVGLRQYTSLLANERWQVSVQNIAIFGVLFIAMALALGFVLAALIDQRVRAEGLLRSVFLYPFSMSFIVTGLAWRWLLDPTLGIEKVGHDLGLGLVPLRLAGAAGARDLHAGVRRGLACRRPGDGDHAGRAARRRSRNLEGGTSGRHPGLACLSVHRRAADARQFRHRRHPARGQRGAALRPVGGDDQRRARHRLRGAGQVRHGPPVRARQCRPCHRRRDDDADHRGRGARAADVLAIPTARSGARHERCQSGDRTAAAHGN